MLLLCQRLTTVLTWLGCCDSGYSIFLLEALTKVMKDLLTYHEEDSVLPDRSNSCLLAPNLWFDALERQTHKHIILGVVSILWVVLKYFRFHSKDLVFDVTDVVYTLSFKSLRTHSFIHSVDLRFTKTDFCHGYCGANLVDLLLNHKNAGMQITHSL